jgi:signal transduction histidine kinase
MFRPWRQPFRTWATLVHLILDPVFASLFFVPTVTLLSLSVGLLPIFPAAVPIGWLLFVLARGMGRLERSRLAALLGLELADPHPALPEASWWARLKARLRSPSRWREIGYLLLQLPVSVVTFSVVIAAWCGALALVALPAYYTALPAGRAHFGLLTISTAPAAALACVVGVVGLAVMAPWLTLAAAGVDTALARWLLAPREDLRSRVGKLEASRAAAVDSAEAERRRIERDLHDGAQQRLVSVAMDLGRAQQRFETDPEGARLLVRGAHEDAKAALAELRQLVRGFHPAILEDRGLDAALSSVIARSPVPVTLSVDISHRPSAPIESAVYFVVLEALTNVAKHAQATKAAVTIVRRNDRLVVEVTDDGVGGADPASGTGLAGLTERVSAHGGWLQVLSPAGGPTTLLAEIPCAS